MQFGDLVAELWFYVPLIGFLLVAFALAAIGISASLRARNRPGGIEYEFAASEPEAPDQRRAERPDSQEDRP